MRHSPALLPQPPELLQWVGFCPSPFCWGSFIKASPHPDLCLPAPCRAQNRENSPGLWTSDLDSFGLENRLRARNYQKALPQKLPSVSPELHRDLPLLQLPTRLLRHRPQAVMWSRFLLCVVFPTLSLTAWYRPGWPVSHLSASQRLGCSGSHTSLLSLLAPAP